MTTVAGGILEALLVGVLLLAGAAKLLDQTGAREAAVGFGVPRRAAPFVALSIPAVELLAAGLLLSRTAEWGALGAAALLSVFAVAIAVALAGKRRPDCHCFGALHSASVSGVTLARTGALAVAAWTAAAFELAATDGNFLNQSLGFLLGEQAPVVAGFAVVALIAFVQGWFILQLLRQQGRLLVRIERLEGLPAHGHTPPGALEVVRPGGAETLPDARLVGSAAPDFTLDSVDGDTVTLNASLADGHQTLMVFVDPQCGPCVELLPTLAGWSHELAGGVTLTVIATGERDAARALADKYGLRGMLLDEDESVMTAFGVYGTPAAVLVGRDGRIASAVASGALPIGDLVKRTAAVERLVAAGAGT
jgi:peroxiredoxin